MSIENVLNYIKYTPHNTNLTILRQMLANEGKSSEEIERIVGYADKNRHCMNIAVLASLLGTGIERLEGDGQDYYTLAPTPLSFRSTAPLDEFKELLVNGEVIDPNNYTLEEGSTIVKLSIDYLKTLSTGGYNIDVVSTNKKVGGNFTVTAPKLNEYGFYYNQPYCANVPYLGGDTAVFIRPDGKLNLIVVGNSNVDTCTYVVEDDKIVITDQQGIVFTAVFSNYGYTAYVAELGATFELGTEAFAADNEYLYIYNDEVNGYEAYCINDTKPSYAPVKTGINDIPTVRIGKQTCSKNPNLNEIPEMPETITEIGVSAFSFCPALTKVVIPSHITKICAYVFESCDNLETVIIEQGLQEIEQFAFARCYKLKNIKYTGTIEQWKAITQGSRCWFEIPGTHVQCSNGSTNL